MVTSAKISDLARIWLGCGSDVARMSVGCGLAEVKGKRFPPGRNYIRPPPPPPFSGQKAFSGEGGGGVYFEAPRGRNFIRPLPFIHPHA